MREFKVTFREVLVGVIIFLLMLTIGFFISNSIQEHYLDKNTKYFRALKIEDENTFNYAIKTSIGNTLTYGTFKADNPVKYEEVKGEYFYVSKTTEKYTKHTRRVSYKCGDKTCHRNETYWTWDYVSSESKSTDTFSFMNNHYPYKLLKFNNDKYITTQTFGKIRHIYYGTTIEFNGTWYSKTQNNELLDNELYIGQDIKKVIEDKEKQGGSVSVGFWVVWIILTVVLIVVFIAMDNKYLNKKY